MCSSDLMKAVMAASKQGQWQLLPGGRADVGGVTLESGEFELRLVPKPGIASAALSTNDAVVVLDARVTPELEAEGVARDFVRLVQQARKDQGLNVSDRIRLAVEAGSAVVAALKTHQGYVQEQVLAAQLTFGALPEGMQRTEGKVGSDGAAVAFALAAIE